MNVSTTVGRKACRGCPLSTICLDPALVAASEMAAGEELRLPRRCRQDPFVRVVCSGCLKTIHEGASGSASNGRS